jgi:IclR family acetate operon transcriptional repressor
VKIEKKKSKYQVPNLERALKIMEYLAEQPKYATMAEIARSLKYPNNSVFRIVSTLEEEGYLVRENESKNYRLSRKLLSLGYQALVETSLIEKALDILMDLRDESGETALIGTLLEGEGVVLEQIPSNEPIKFMVTPGARFMLHTAAPAKAILAFLDAKEAKRQIETIDFVRFNSQTICSINEYNKELERVRQCGYATDKGEEANGIICVSAPVFDYRSRPTAAIWITGPQFRIPTQKIPQLGQLLIKHANNLSIRLGFQQGNSSILIDKDLKSGNL